MTEQEQLNPILLTTAISYTNGKPHIGHLYESVLADFIKNVFVILDHPTKLLTGTDEHGKKIQETAISEKTEPINICNKYSALFKQMNNNIQMSYDHFIRTTDESHKQFVSESVLKSLLNSDIYLSEYEGWYDIKEETYINETEAKINNYVNPLTEKPYERVKEETYMFKLKKYEEVVKNLLENKEWIIPNSYAGEQIKRIWPEIAETDGLIDLSITRTTFDWGIKFPQAILDNTKLSNSTKSHVIYVWFDALLNYISGRNLLYANNSTQTQPLQTYHLIGKDIIWFHSVIYPAILSSIGEPLPNSILVHGFVLDDQGRKMSKSLGNVIDVELLQSKYSVEAIRYYLINETIFGSDILFSESNLIATYNNILLKNFGNLWQRMYNLLRPIESELNSWLSNNSNHEKIISFKQDIYNQVKTFKTNFNFIEYRNILNKLLDHANKELTEKMPWKIQSDTELNIQNKIEIFADIFLHFNCACCLMYAIIPEKTIELVGYFNWTIEQLKLNCSNINFKYMSDEKKIIAFNKLN